MVGSRPINTSAAFAAVLLVASWSTGRCKFVPASQVVSSDEQRLCLPHGTSPSRPSPAVRTAHGVDTLCPVTSKLVHLARRASVVLLAEASSSLPAVPPAPTSRSSGAAPSPEPVDPWHAVWLLVGIPCCSSS